MKRIPGRRPLERHVQAGIVRLFKACGGVVYSTSQGYRHDPGGTRMTPGLSDLVVFFPRLQRTLFFEVKAPGGKRTPAQGVFAETVVHSGSSYGFGGMDAALACMRQWGLIAGESAA